MPAAPVSSTNSYFQSNTQTGSGTTTISWSDVTGEEGESYAIYSSGQAFSSTTEFGVQQNLVPEGNLNINIKFQLVGLAPLIIVLS